MRLNRLKGKCNLYLLVWIKEDKNPSVHIYFHNLCTLFNPQQIDFFFIRCYGLKIAMIKVLV